MSVLFVIKRIIVHTDTEIGSTGFIMYSFVAPSISIALSYFYNREKAIFKIDIDSYLTAEKVTPEQFASGSP